MSLPPGDHRGLRGSPSTTMTGNKRRRHHHHHHHHRDIVTWSLLVESRAGPARQGEEPVPAEDQAAALGGGPAGGAGLGPAPGGLLVAGQDHRQPPAHAAALPPGLPGHLHLQQQAGRAPAAPPGLDGRGLPPAGAPRRAPHAPRGPRPDAPRDPPARAGAGRLLPGPPRTLPAPAPGTGPAALAAGGAPGHALQAPPLRGASGVRQGRAA
ncbi:proline-rich proteoglycan 2-like isoform X2 [Anolis carolinensis]|uniref:proline-rich proteoglycan 2-like isoform X2 n=1 Tax=Anolis carolinensis TaxID=28377 RepID=UPI002F2B3D1E